MANELNNIMSACLENSAIGWECPYCNRPTTITSLDYSFSSVEQKTIRIYTLLICCPNSECKKQAIYNCKYYVVFIPGRGTQLKGQPIYVNQLEPCHNAKEYPSYIPQPIRNDYVEACKILGLSPKASATISRRCIQGMIRDFWQISKRTLNEEINELRGKIDTNIWQGIDALRKIGNIGAHMERDVNVIVDVDTDEAELLIKLNETLIKEWYINRFEREQNIKNILNVSKSKDEQKNA